MTMVGMLVQRVTRCSAISRAAYSRCQRGISTSAAPLASVPCMTTTMPVMWNIGTTPSTTSSWLPLAHRPPANTLCCRLRCLCMQPLGWPVVPLV